MSEPIQIAVGQVWTDKQKGQEGRTVRIEEVDGADNGFVLTRLLTPADNAWTDMTGRRSRVRRSTLLRSYRLVSASGFLGGAPSPSGEETT
jgi:hypothetical protein